MSGQWEAKNGKRYWVKAGKDYVELHEDGRGLITRVDGTSRDQAEKYVRSPRLLLVFG